MRIIPQHVSGHVRDTCMKFLEINKFKFYMLVTCRQCFRINNVSFLSTMVLWRRLILQSGQTFFGQYLPHRLSDIRHKALVAWFARIGNSSDSGESAWRTIKDRGFNCKWFAWIDSRESRCESPVPLSIRLLLTKIILKLLILKSCKMSRVIPWKSLSFLEIFRDAETLRLIFATIWCQRVDCQDKTHPKLDILLYISFLAAVFANHTALKQEMNYSGMNKIVQAVRTNSVLSIPKTLRFRKRGTLPFGIAPPIAAIFYFSKFGHLPVLPFLVFLKRQGKPPKKQGFFLSAPNPWNLWKRKEKRSKKKEFLAEEKTRNSKKTRKGRTGLRLVFAV